MKKILFGAIAVLEVAGTAFFFQTAFHQANPVLASCALVFGFVCAAAVSLTTAGLLHQRR